MFDHAEHLKDPTEASCLEGVSFLGDGIVTFQDSEPYACRRTPVMFFVNVLILVWVLMYGDSQRFRMLENLAVIYPALEVCGRVSIGCDLVANVYEIIDFFYFVVVSCVFAIFL